MAKVTIQYWAAARAAAGVRNDECKMTSGSKTAASYNNPAVVQALRL